MLMISDVVDNYQVDILCADPFGPTMLRIEMITPCPLLLVDKVYDNAQMASASLVSRLMYGQAIDLLTKHDVPKTHAIWDLNHSRMWDRSTPYVAPTSSEDEGLAP